MIHPHTVFTVLSVSSKTVIFANNYFFVCFALLEENTLIFIISEFKVVGVSLVDLFSLLQTD